MAILKFIGCEGEPHVEKVVSGDTIAAKDLVTLQTDGQAEVTGAGEPIFGQALNAATSGADLYVLRGSRMQFIMDNDNVGTTFAASHVGARADTIGGTGAQKIDTSSVAQVGDGTDTGQVLLIAYNPKGFGYDTDTSLCIAEVIERQ